MLAPHCLVYLWLKGGVLLAVGSLTEGTPGLCQSVYLLAFYYCVGMPKTVNLDRRKV